MKLKKGNETLNRLLSEEYSNFYDLYHFRYRVEVERRSKSN
jgi:hypothetical protein